MNKKKIILSIIIIIILAGVFIYINRTEPSLCVKNYFECLKNKNYEDMYNYVSTDISKEDFITRVKNIYEGIEANKISIAVISNIDDEEITKVTYNNSMETSAGFVSLINTVSVKKVNGEYKILWDSSVIFPDLKDDYKVKVTNISSTRGTIFDRNGKTLAKDGDAYYVGLVPRKNGRVN